MMPPVSVVSEVSGSATYPLFPLRACALYRKPMISLTKEKGLSGKTGDFTDFTYQRTTNNRR